jgi:putative membrane-bound dehydrogenase-like protein
MFVPPEPSTTEVERMRLPYAAILLALATTVTAADRIPHGQTQPPGPALTPKQAVEKMTVPPGFAVELVASEPDLVNPVAMTIDEKGRFWVTESLEYPRREPGPGRDRVKILEDTDGDGKVDRTTLFAEGLNIPSGIAVGHGGVWVANSPDILFYKIGPDGKADGKPEVVVSGFGRADTHELPNSLTWGPDGWLYGLNGVFNPSVIKHRGKEYRFTCALFRIHPKTRDFEVFCEGTSNPWGVAFDGEGSAFVSACVIDHLWHLSETGYYHRQGGAYPPFTWILPSIVKHKHQKAAYCGIHYFDSDAYPPEYRDKLYMGNIHGGCINSDELTRDGSTYFGKPRPDFLTANDAWFMPVVQKTGPDGCLYVLDWYDRYHCYQDANADPKGIDRLHGRLYRIRYKDTPRAKSFDLAKENNSQLVERLSSPNVFFRDHAQRILTERDDPNSAEVLEQLVLDDKKPRKARLHALWALVSTGSLSIALHESLLKHEDPTFRAWGVRAAGNYHKVPDSIAVRVAKLSSDPLPDVRLQVAIAARKVVTLDPVPVLLAVLANSADDKLIPGIVWQNLHPLLESRGAEVTSRLAKLDLSKPILRDQFLPRMIDRLLGVSEPKVDALATLADVLLGAKGNEAAAARCLASLAQKVQTREIAGRPLDTLKARLRPQLLALIEKKPDSPVTTDAMLLLTSWKDEQGLTTVRGVFASEKSPVERRLQALEALTAAGDATVLGTVGKVLADREAAQPLRAGVLGALTRLDDPKVAEVVLAAYPTMERPMQSRAVELLTQRSAWAKALLEAIGKKTVAHEALNINQVRKLMLSRDAEVLELVKKRWGTVRADRNPAREKVIAEMRALLKTNPGNAIKGQAVFEKACGVCHKIHGKGQEVGPDITSNGRASVEQLLHNLLDPNRVIGVGYQPRTVQTKDGRALIGLPVEDSEQRIVLKVQGGKLETIPRREIEETYLSQVSMMPEDLEKTMSKEELLDLFAFLSLDKPPSDPTAKRIPEDRVVTPRKTNNAAEFALLLAEVAPGFTTDRSGEGGVELVKEHRGRAVVVVTHPPDRKEPCVLRSTMPVPSGKKTTLILDVSHHPKGDWLLVVRANGKKLHESVVGPKTAPNGWARVEVDLTPLAGKDVKLEVQNAANDWSWEHAFWGGVAVVTEDAAKK